MSTKNAVKNVFIDKKVNSKIYVESCKNDNECVQKRLKKSYQILKVD